MNRRAVLKTALMGAPLLPEVAAQTSALDLTGFGVKGDGRTDDTTAIQKVLDAAAATGGTIRLPAAKYLVAGSLRIPPGVCLEGVHDSPRWPAPLTGTVILATGGRDQEEGPAFFEMGSGGMVRGLTVYYPEQKATEIHPYAWTFHLQGLDNTVENVTLVNSYNGIRVVLKITGGIASAAWWAACCRGDCWWITPRILGVWKIFSGIATSGWRRSGWQSQGRV